MRAAFFDMDGVLFDSMPDHSQAWEEVMSRHQLKFTARDAYIHEGRTGEDVIHHCILRDRGREPRAGEVEAIYEEKTQAFFHRNETHIIPWVDQVLQTLKKQGVLLFVVTGSGQKSLLDRLNHFFPDIFSPERVVSAYDYTHGKPDPEPYLKAFEKARNLLPNLQKEDCIVVENAPLGVKAGASAGLPVWAVNTGPLPDRMLAQEGASEVFASMQDVLYRLEGKKRRVLLAYYTGTYNTRYISEKIKKQLEQDGCEVDLYEINPCRHEQQRYEDYDLIGFGYPIYGFTAPYPFLKFIRSQRFPKGMHYFIYKTSGETFHDNDASSMYVIRTLRRRRCKIDSEYHIPMPYNIHFRYEDKLVRELLYMADRQIEILSYEVRHGLRNWKGYGWFAWFATTITGHFMYIAGDINSWFYKVDKKKCINCDLCIKNCPTHNIYRNESDTIRFRHNCLMCMRCSLNCPQNAIWIGFLDSWKWKVNQPYHLKKIEEMPYEPVISNETIGFFECYIEKFVQINQRHAELFGADANLNSLDNDNSGNKRKPHSMLYRLVRLLFTGITVKEP